MTPAYHGDGIDGQSANAATTTDAVGLLADELNQFAMTVEEYAWREGQSATDRLDESGAARARLLFKAARRLCIRNAEEALRV